MSGAHPDPAAAATHEHVAAAKDAEAFWEPHHASTPTSIDGPLPGPNPVLVDVTADLVPGTALDLGCGQDDDALWLARRGWAVTTVDVSPTALGRVAARADRAGLSERVRARRHDLSATFPEGSFDLVNAEHFHSPVAMDRAAVLRRPAPCSGRGELRGDAAGGRPRLGAPVVVGRSRQRPTPEQTLDGIGLDAGGWQVVAADDRDRQASGPGGQRATVTDTVIVLVRL